MCAQTVYKKFSIGEADNIEAVKALRDAGLYMPVFDATLTPLLDAPHSIVSTDGADEHEAPEGADEDEAEAEAPGAGPLNPPLAAPTAAQAALSDAPPAIPASGVKQVSYAQKGDALMNLLAV